MWCNLNARYTEPYGHNKQSFVGLLGKEDVVHAYTPTIKVKRKKTDRRCCPAGIACACVCVRNFVSWSVMLAACSLWNTDDMLEIKRCCHFRFQCQSFGEEGFDERGCNHFEKVAMEIEERQRKRKRDTYREAERGGNRGGNVSITVKPGWVCPTCWAQLIGFPVEHSCSHQSRSCKFIWCIRFNPPTL